MDADHEAQRQEYEPPRLLTTEQIMQGFRDGYAGDIDPGLARQRAAIALAERVVDLEGSLAYAEATELYPEDLYADGVLLEVAHERDQALLELGRLDPDGGELARARADSGGVRARAANAEFLEQDREAERLARLEDLQWVEYEPPPVDPQYRRDADYLSVVLANTRVVPTETVAADRSSPPTADTARFQMQLAIAQQVAANQVRAQQRADTEAAERIAAAALGQYIAPASSVPARNTHRIYPGSVHL